MKQHGFSKKGNCFFRLENDIAFCVAVDCPTTIAYVTFFIIPLFVPSRNRYYTYGNRLNHVMPNAFPALDLTVPESSVTGWTMQFKAGTENVIFPFFEKIESPEKMVHFIDSNGNVQNFFHCPEIQLTRLLMFTHAYLRDFGKLDVLTQNMTEQINDCSFLSMQVLAKYSDEVNTIKRILPHEESLDEYFTDIIRNTKLACFGQ